MLRKLDYSDDNKIDYDFNIDIKNFGSIKKGSINLKPLTILVGPNNSGKSYAALLIHALTNNLYNICQELPFHLHMNQSMKKRHKSSNQKMMNLRMKVKNHNLMFSSAAKELNRDLNKYFTEDVYKLINVNAKSSQINVKSKFFGLKITHSKNTRKIKFTSKFNPDIIIQNKPEKFNYIENIKKNTLHINMDLNRHVKKYMNSDDYDVEDFALLPFSKYLGATIPTSLYFPAGRSGILHAQNTIASVMFRSIPEIGLRDIKLPKMHGVISDFLSESILWGSNRSYRVYDNPQITKIVNKFEKDILGGQIKTMKGKSSSGQPVYFYRKKILPLQLVSSAVSELMPFILYFKNVVTLGKLLIIEEPESHLHPNNQIYFAQFLVKLIDAGLNIVMITHSPIILEAISHSVQRNSLKKNNKNDKVRISHNDISAYLFKTNSVHDTVIEQLPINDSGIPQDVFNDIINILYEDYHEIQSKIERYTS